MVSGAGVSWAPGRSTAILSPKRKKQLPKTKAANLEAHMRMVRASTFIQARAERLGNRCQSWMMEKSNGSEEAIAAN